MSGTLRPDTVGSVSGMSVPDIEVSAKITLPDLADGPTPPLQPGWLVAYRNRQQLLCGGCDDRQHGTIQECRWGGAAWTVHLTDGQWLSLAGIRSVGKTDGEGELVAAWTVREHGYDGMKGERSPVGDEAIPIELMCEEALPDTRAAQGQ